MMFAKNLKPGQTVKVTPEDGGEILHISQVCMSKPVDGNRTYLKIVQGSQSFAACVLQRDKQESCSVDLFLSAREGIQLALEGGKNELSVIGYFEPEPESESEDEGDMAGFEGESEEESEEEDLSEDETDGMTAPVIRDGRVEDLDAQEEDSKKKAKTANNNKKTQALKALQAAAANDDDDEDDEDDEEEDEDEDGDEGESEDDEENDDNEDDDEEDDEEDDEDDEEEEEEEEPAPTPQDKKRKGQQQQQKQQQQQQGNKKAKTQAAASSSGSGGGDEATYRNALIEFLKKNGPTPLASLGQKVKKPASLPKMAAFLKANPNTFSVEGGKCSLK
ncbi:46 kDa FK506-binding nuclear protein, putative [Eimeria acervulina]|uniref:46 kDa FK506-binding nuclear protein, putative n=1 Tax=Eimeria acervulina TaxID=5801 RepID=U6GHF0_EIMAC|nr:46 kDa FK506-binding nuclear protein, putative [Eimeria acervulina]CDI78713.1 46 kDa FK506-binding nuclear protein, putative [Eimeria acervulina]